MALTRARVVAGEATLARDIEAVVARDVAKGRASRGGSRATSRDMRALIAREKGDKGRFDLKLAPGGLIDIEFLAQFLILAHAAAHPALMRPETRAALAEAARAGLISAADGEALAEAHRLMTAVTQALRLTLADDAEPQDAAAGVKRRIAASAGAPDFERLSAELAEARVRVRAIRQRLLA